MVSTLMTQMTIGELLRRHRLEASLTQKELAELLTYDHTTVSRVERNERLPGQAYLAEVANALHLSDTQRQVLIALYELATGKEETASIPTHREDWGQAPDVSVFFGRQAELADLEQWVVTDRCRLIAVLGMGGIGKTTLVTKLAQRIKGKFAYVLWRSLLNAPPLTEILSDALKFLSDQQLIDLPDEPSQQITHLITLLRERRCLLILDNAEAILQPGERAGYYRAGYEAYGQLLQQVGRTAHQSCLLLTSREAPKEFTPLASPTAPVRTLALTGLAQSDSRHLLQDRHLIGDETAWELLTQLYAGNPLALQQVSANIQDLFGGDIKTFLKEITNTVFGDIRFLLDQQFDRLSALERDIMFWLAINREPTTLAELKDDLVHPINSGELLEALESLRRRSLVENSAMGFTLQNVITEYLTDKLVQQVCEEIMTQQPDLFNSHALMKATAKTYVRQSQGRLILKPVVERLLAIFSRKEFEERLKNLLTTSREKTPLAPGYLGGNILNLMCHLEWELGNHDFSHLTLWQAYLQGVVLQNVNFAYADLTKSVFTNTFGSILSVVFSPNGDLIAMGTANGKIRLLQIADGKLSVTIRDFTTWVEALAFSPDGNILASGSDSPTIRLWSVNSGHCLRTLQGHTSRIRSITFSPDGYFLASTSKDGTIRLWDVHTGECIKIFSGYPGYERSVTFSPDSQFLASGSDKNEIRLWNVQTGNHFLSWQGHEGQVRSVAFSLNGHLLASGGEDQVVRIWDTLNWQGLKVLQGHTDRVRFVIFSPNSNLLASGSEDRTIKLWNVRTGQCLTTLKEHTNRVRSITFSPDGHLMASASEDQLVRIWETKTWKCLNTLYGYANQVRSVIFSADGQTLASGYDEPEIRLWSIQTGKCFLTLRGHKNSVRALAFNSDGSLLASGGKDRSIRLWNANTGKCYKILEVPAQILSIAISPNGHFVATGSEDHMVRFWHLENGEHLFTLPHNAANIRSLAFSRDGYTLATGGEDHTIRMWDVQSGECIKILQGHEDRVWCCIFNHNGNMLASSSDDQTIRLWDIFTGKCLKIFYGHHSLVRTVAFSPNDHVLASGSVDQTIKLWDIKTGQCIRTLPGHTKPVRSVAFNPNEGEEMLASGSSDGTIRLWNIRSGKYLKTLRPDRPYERMNITGVTGLTEAQKASLKALGAIEDDESTPQDTRK